MEAMLVWLREARTCASRWKRAISGVSRANSCRITFSATSRPSFESAARYTSPVPPVPSGDRISYGPSLVPAVSAIRARNYSLRNTLHAETTILGGLSATLTLGVLPRLPVTRVEPQRASAKEPRFTESACKRVAHADVPSLPQVSVPATPAILLFRQPSRF